MSSVDQLWRRRFPFDDETCVPYRDKGREFYSEETEYGTSPASASSDLPGNNSSVLLYPTNRS